MSYKSTINFVFSIGIGSILMFSNMTGAAEKLFIAAEGTDNVSVVNVATDTVITNIFTGTGSIPHNPIASPDGQFVYVTLMGTGNIAKIDAVTNTLVNTFSTGGAAPVHLDVSNDGNWLYINNRTDDQIVKMNTADGSLVGSYTFGGTPSNTYTPHDVNIGPDGNIWITDETTNTVSVLAPDLSVLSAAIGVGARPIQIAFSPDGTQAYTTNFDDNTVSILDVGSYSQIDSFLMSPTGTMGPMGVVVSPDGGTLWMSGTTGNTVHGHSLLAGDNYSYQEVTGLIGAHGLDISDDGNYLFTSIFYDGSSTGRDAIAVIDTTTGTLVSKFYTPGADDLHGVVYVSAVPVPAAIWLFGSGLLGLAGIGWKRNKVNS